MKKLIVTLIVSLLAFAPAFVAHAQGSEVPSLTSAQYASMDKNDIYVIMFTVQGCLPCAQAKKLLLPSLVEKYAADEKVHVFTFLADDAKDVTASGQQHLYKDLGVSVGPTFVVLHEGAVKYSHAGFSKNQSAGLKQEIINAVSREK